MNRIEQAKSLLLINLLCLLGGSFVQAEQKSFKINSESYRYDIPNQIMVYTGNTKFQSDDVSIQGNELNIYSANKAEQNIKVTGTPVELIQISTSKDQKMELSANKIEYFLNEKNIHAEENIVFYQHSFDPKAQKMLRFFRATGDELNIITLPQKKIRISGSPLQVTISQPNQTPLTASANEMFYDQQSQNFELLGSVFLTRESEIIKAEKILYNGETRVLQIPKNQNHPVEMIQTIKENHE